MTVSLDEIPYKDLRRAGVKDDLAFEPAKGGEGSIAATMQITNDDDASAIAHRIFELYRELDHRLQRGEPLED
jgi:hypothetical protein